MNRLTSTYLDLVRFAAAVVVFLVHARHDRFTSGWLLPLRHYGNDAVMVFFVLSGFVIAYCVDTKEKNIVDYSVSRFSRLYSVAIPALALTVVADSFGYWADAAIYKTVTFERPAMALTANLLFVNQIWFLNLSPLSNNPFWSLSYEFWYYALFAAMLFLSGRQRLVAIAAVSALVGPKILLLLPVWLMGVWAYRYSQRSNLTLAVAVTLFVGSIATYILFRAIDLPLRLGHNTARLIGVEFYEVQLGESRNFLFSYIAGILVTANFIGFHALSKHLKSFSFPFEGTIRKCASYTFSLYLLHFPLLNFYAAVLHNDPTSPIDQFILITCTLFTVVLMGRVSEHKKGWWKAKILSLVPPKIAAAQH